MATQQPASGQQDSIPGAPALAAPAVAPGMMVPEVPSGLSAATEGGPLMEVVLAGGMPWLETVVWEVEGMPAGGERAAGL